MIDLGRLLPLLGRHVVRRAHGLLRASERHIGRRRAEQLRESEVRDLHAAAPVDEDVLRLDVAVDDALVVRVLQRVAHLAHDAERLLRLDLARAHHLPQVRAVDVLHHEVVQAACDARVVDVDDRRVVEARQRAPLAREALREGRVARRIGWQHLDRHRALQPLLHGLVDRAHPAAPDELDELVLREERRELLGRRRRRRLLRSGHEQLRPRVPAEPEPEQAPRARASGPEGIPALGAASLCVPVGHVARVLEPSMSAEASLSGGYARRERTHEACEGLPRAAIRLRSSSSGSASGPTVSAIS